MKTLFKILAVSLIIISLANFIYIRKDKHAANLEYQANEIITSTTKAVLEIFYSALFDKAPLDINSVQVHSSSSTARLFSDLNIKFYNYQFSQSTLSGEIKVKFLGFNEGNKPCYKIIYPDNFYVDINGRKFQVFGTEIFCIDRGFYTFNDYTDDLIKLDGDLNIKHKQTLLKIKDKDILLKSFVPVAGLRTVLNKTLDEKVFDFQQNQVIKGSNLESLAK